MIVRIVWMENLVVSVVDSVDRDAHGAGGRVVDDP